MTTHTAQRTGPSVYSIKSLRIETGDRLVWTSPLGTHTYDVVGEPFSYGWRCGMVRVREVGGHSDGNEFGMHFDLRA